jgi:threonyl-tRNA synthetase
LLVVGDKEMEAGEVAVRSRKGEDLGKLSINEFIERANQEVLDKKID